MRKEKLDDLIKNKLDSYSSSVPDHIWEGISAQIDNPSSKKGFYFNPIWGLIGSAATVLGLFLYTTMQYDVDVSSDLNPEKKDIVMEVPLTIEKSSSSDLLSGKQSESFVQSSSEYKEENLGEDILVLRADQISGIPISPDNKSITKDKQPMKTLLIIAEDAEEELVLGENLADVVEENVLTNKNKSTKRRDAHINTIASLYQMKMYSSPIFKKGQCADFRESQNSLFWSMAYSFDKPIRTIRSRNESMSTYADLRDQSESPVSAFSVNMNLGLRLRNDMVFRTGINYSRIKEDFSHDVESSRETIISNIYNNEGELVNSDTSINIIFTNHSSTNLYETIDIPLLFGIERSNKKFGMGFFTGAFLNVAFSKSGTILSPIDPNVPISLNGEGSTGAFFNHRLGFSFYTSTLVSYKLNSRVQFNAEPYFRYFPASFSNRNYSVDQNYYIFGGQLGLRYYL